MPLLLETAFNEVTTKNGQKPNLYLETSSGPITAEVWIIPDVRDKSRQAVLNFTSRSGSVQAKVVRLTQNHPSFNYEEGKVLTWRKTALPRQLEWSTSESRH